MAIRVRVKNGKQVIVPLRGARAVTGAPVADAPDVDDHGFEMGTRPGTWGRTPTRGAMFSITEGDTVRVRVSREDIDATAPLYAVSSDTSVIEVVQPSGGGPIPGSGVLHIRGVRDFANRDVKVEIHLGAVGGPIIGEVEPHIFRMYDNLELQLRVHFVTIRGVPTTRTPAGLPALMEAVNAIWRPCGISFAVRSQNSPNVDRVLRQFDPAQPLFRTPGEANDADNNEVDTVFCTDRNPRMINVYFIHDFGDHRTRGMAASNKFGWTRGYGACITDAADSNDLAHELGHVLDIAVHTDEDNSSPANHVREDMWARRCLMFSFNPHSDATDPAHRRDVGYGADVRGALITVKNLGCDPRDGELNTARRHARSGPY